LKSETGNLKLRAKPQALFLNPESSAIPSVEAAPQAANALPESRILNAESCFTASRCLGGEGFADTGVVLLILAKAVLRYA
jgi:hypothetical protein